MSYSHTAKQMCPILTGMNILFELRLMHMCPTHPGNRTHRAKIRDDGTHMPSKNWGNSSAEKNRTPFFHPCENRTPFFHPSPCENRTHFFSPVRIGHIFKPCENRTHLFTSSPVRIGHTFWWTCTLSSLGKKVVTHLHRFKCRKKPSDVTN